MRETRCHSIVHTSTFSSNETTDGPDRIIF